MSRRERIWKAGTRVRLDTTAYTPPDWWNGRATVAMTRDDPEQAVFLLQDGCSFRAPHRSAVFVCGSAEVARLRDQTPNAEHQPPGGRWDPFWWEKARAWGDRGYAPQMQGE